MLADLAATLTPVPHRLDVPTFGSEPGSAADTWLSIDHPRAGELRALALDALPHLAGSTLVHTDIREDNLLVDDAGTIWVCDWNWVCSGAPWIDALCVLVCAYGDGLDADAVLASYPLTEAVPSEVVDGFLCRDAGKIDDAPAGQFGEIGR